MCGIVGLAIKPDSREVVETNVLNSMRDTLIHRGPDGCGSYISENRKVGLAHRRLSIIDLSENGRQPMSNEDGTIWITYNGEIYNFKSIKEDLIKKGHIFKSHTDTEVVIHSYEEYGSECLDLFEGMFAFAIYNEGKRKLFLARDRFGIKPLYYGFLDNNTFAFASELKALVVHPNFKKEIDYEALGSYFSYRYIPAPKSIWKNIYKLTHGHFVELDIKDWCLSEQKKHYSLIDKISGGRSSTFEEIEYLIRDSVEKTLVGDVDVGIFLSGGLDSASIAAFAKKEHSRIKAFTIGFNDERNEAIHASEIASFLGVDHFVEYVDDLDEIVLNKIASIYDEPFADDSIFPTYILSKMTSKHIKVALSGDGGDEVFAGYRWYEKYLKNQSFSNYIKQFLQGESSFENLYKNTLGFGISKKTISNTFNGALSKKMVSHNDLFSAYNKKEMSSVRKLQYVDLNTFMVDQVLVKVDRASMASSLEVRVPFLNHKVVESVLCLGENEYPSNSSNKPVLRRIMKEKLPESVFERPKRGFGAPFLNWRMFQRERILDIFKQSEIVKDGLVTNRSLKKLRSNDLFLLYIFELWYKKWMQAI